ncbi:hypothetical protein M406DRAFT_326362 [Cryphonectria parasitica EP155]|uniref:Uncharacterized protein n=1 Tax=Cryphonectria parasitica (strain ATCC 38755 / EP155) TaxID=660469 RepID=A0A9P4YDA8_CRYP1|nr:uncharacterized protein M406DRAFT_326362 [Cryphonectria parasitica EP155]KAF3770951.1 hypothetical protein M406DRAFT_326362 [Cryphonectria parasitica EP155]
MPPQPQNKFLFEGKPLPLALEEWDSCVDEVQETALWKPKVIYEKGEPKPASFDLNRVSRVYAITLYLYAEKKNKTSCINCTAHQSRGPLMSQLFKSQGTCKKRKQEHKEEERKVGVLTCENARVRTVSDLEAWLDLIQRELQRRAEHKVRMATPDDL